MVSAPKSAISEDQKILLLKSYMSQGLTNIEIGKKFEVHDATIGRWQKKYKLKPDANRKKTTVQKLQPGAEKAESAKIEPPEIKKGVIDSSGPKVAYSNPSDMMRDIAMGNATNPTTVQLTALKHMLENPGLYGQKEQKPPISIPKILNPKQLEISAAITDENTQFVIIEGDRRTGKSTIVWWAIHEDIWNGTRKEWGMWAAIEQTAIKIHSDVYGDVITWKETSVMHRGHTQKRTAILDGGLTINATTVSASSGKKYEGIWIDELHTVLADNPKVLATIAAILRSEPHLKMVLSMNKGTGAYEVFLDDFKDMIISGRAKFFTLEKSDCEHISDEADEACRILMTAAMGEEFAQLQLDNVANETGQPFPPRLIMECMSEYDSYIDGIQDHIDKMEYMATVGVDPGFTHATGYMCLGLYRGTIFELESGMLKGKNNDEERIKAVIGEVADSHCANIRSESNSGGLHWMKFWREVLGIDATASNFNSSPNSAFSRTNMIKLVRGMMNLHRIVFFNSDLKRQLLKYNPEKDVNDSKGDLADAFIHAAAYLILNYCSHTTNGKVVYTT